MHPNQNDITFLKPYNSKQLQISITAPIFRPLALVVHLVYLRARLIKYRIDLSSFSDPHFNSLLCSINLAKGGDFL